MPTAWQISSIVCFFCHRQLRFSKTINLYDRTSNAITLDETVRIVI
jgi:hypothetical protein